MTSGRRLPLMIPGAILGALALTAAAPAEHRARPQPRPPLGHDWLRGGAEPEAVFGPRRATEPARTLAASDIGTGEGEAVRPRTAFRKRSEETPMKAGAAPAP